ncbi:hypothetical protein [Dongia sp.]|uniref:hypothetical protein n=1 Tax=Dongia sp. TaxID=1977262 RepID=UPI003753522A
MIELLLSRPYRAVEPRFAGYLRRYLAEHHESCADWVPEISEPMFRQLILDGLSRTLGFYIFLLATLLVPLAVWRTEGNVANAVVAAIFGSAIFLLNWRRLVTQCVDREFSFRRQHGKWRWER